MGADRNWEELAAMPKGRRAVVRLKEIELQRLVAATRGRRSVIPSQLTLSAGVPCRWILLSAWV
jgi:hypothetical protein